MTELSVSVERLTRDQRNAALTLDRRQARYFVDSYYQSQEDRIRAAGRIHAMEKSGEPHLLIQWLELQSQTIEEQIKGLLDKYSKSQPIGQWMRAVKGIGPVLAAGYMAHLDIERRDEETDDLVYTTAGKFYAACGLSPAINPETGHRMDRRVRGHKFSYNPALKRLAWLTGESFKRFPSTDEDAYYRHWYDRRKAYETAKNNNGDYIALCKESLEEKKFGSDTIAKQWYTGMWVLNPALNEDFKTALLQLPKLEKKKRKGEEVAVEAIDADEDPSAAAGRTLRSKFDPVALAELDAKFPLRPMLPPARIDRRSARWATKLFISHMHEVWWRLAFPGTNLPVPFTRAPVYAIRKLGHVDYISPPHLEVVGLTPITIALNS
jgi:hypothetical protein